MTEPEFNQNNTQTSDFKLKAAESEKINLSNLNERAKQDTSFNTLSNANYELRASEHYPKLNKKLKESHPQVREVANSQNIVQIDEQKMVRKLLPCGHGFAKAKVFRISLVNGISKN